MRSVGQFCLLAALVSSGYAAFVHTAFRGRAGGLRRAGTVCGLAAVACLTAVVAILGWALYRRDFSYDYVAHYSSRLLPWQFSISALWVGQAGSLLLWAWFLGAVAVALRLAPAADGRVRDTAFGIVLGHLAFLVAVLVFAADPMKPSLSPPAEGLGLSPLLQHPSMLVHPPVIFLAYALWAAPFALAVAALIHDRPDDWPSIARPWALAAWVVLGAGLLLGAHWAYQELGWGGYWGWDPVENGSFLPWLTGTALVHCLMAWRHRDCLKKTAVALAFLTIGLCNFATFLTRSGVFSSVHAFSESPIGWMFLGLMAGLLAGGVALVIARRGSLAAGRRAGSLFARESLILVAAVLLLALGAAVLGGTLVGPISAQVMGRTILIDPPYYNAVLVPVAAILLLTTGVVPLTRWGEAPGPSQRRGLWTCLALGVAAAAVAWGLGVRHVMLLAVIGVAVLAVTSFAAAVYLDGRRHAPDRPAVGLVAVLLAGRRRYAGYVVHLGFIALAVGVAGSSIGSRRFEVDLSEGDGLTWNGWDVRYVGLDQRELPDKLVAEAVLEVTRGGGGLTEVRPARHYHRLQNEWTTEVAILSTWTGDFYAVLNAGLGDGRVALTLVDNPMVCWIWIGGGLAGLSTIASLWPSRRAAAAVGRADLDRVKRAA